MYLLTLVLIFLALVSSIILSTYKYGQGDMIMSVIYAIFSVAAVAIMILYAITGDSPELAPDTVKCSDLGGTFIEGSCYDLDHTEKIHLGLTTDGNRVK